MKVITKGADELKAAFADILAVDHALRVNVTPASPSMARMVAGFGASAVTNVEAAIKAGATDAAEAGTSLGAANSLLGTLSWTKAAPDDVKPLLAETRGAWQQAKASVGQLLEARGIDLATLPPPRRY